MLSGLSALKLEKLTRPFVTRDKPCLRHQASFCRLYEDLRQVITSEGIQASNFALFKGAIFGRDSLRVALDLLPWYPTVAEIAMISLARLQGTKNNLVSEEEPGKIPHEYRKLHIGGKKIDRGQEKILKELGRKWGWSEAGEEVCYYGSIDATPQFVRLVYLYGKKYGFNVLGRKIKHREGNSTTLKDVVLNATRLIAKQIMDSNLQLLEFCHTNPLGIKWQVLRDGSTAYLHPDGQLANDDAPIASIEVQGLAYDALSMAAEIFSSELPEEAQQWEKLAQVIQTNLEYFWMEEKDFFAMGIDRDEEGKPRQIKTVTSLPGELLESRIFDTLPRKKKDKYILSIISKIYSSDILTDVGVRSRGLSHLDAINYCDYQGSNVSWPVMTNIISLGLHRQGFPKLARDVDTRLLNTATISRTLSEFYYVTPEGHVNYQPYCVLSLDESKEQKVIFGTNVPENVQAWTVSAIFRAKLASEGEPTQSQSVYHNFENELISNYAVKLIEPEESDQVLHSHPSFHIDKYEARKREYELLEREGHL